MNRFLALCAAALLAATLAGCSSVTGGPLVRPGEPTGVLVVHNNTWGNLDAVLISDCSAMSYGFNRLSDGAYIAPGGQVSFTLSAGCWDVGAGEWGGGEAYQRLTIVPGGVVHLTIDE